MTQMTRKIIINNNDNNTQQQRTMQLQTAIYKPKTTLFYSIDSFFFQVDSPICKRAFSNLCGKSYEIWPEVNNSVLYNTFPPLFFTFHQFSIIFLYTIILRRFYYSLFLLYILCIIIFPSIHSFFLYYNSTSPNFGIVILRLLSFTLLYFTLTLPCTYFN